MKNTVPKNYFLIVIALLIIGGSFFTGVYIGNSERSDIRKIENLTNKESDVLVKTDFSPFWKVWNIINDRYVSTGSTTIVADEDKLWGAIQGLASSLDDPYTSFLPPKDAEIFEEDISGNFQGVGMEIGIRDDLLTVIAPIKGTPAEKAGIIAGDKILKIDDKDTTRINSDEAVKLIRGEIGTKVKFTILRNGKKEPLEIVVARGVINIPTLDTELRNGVYIIRLYNFSAVSPDQFRIALREFIKKRTYKLVIDLRGNPGGYLEAAIDMASWFLPTGKVVVREDFGDNRDEVVHRSKGYDIFDKNLKLIVLIDGGSASASEILAGALEEHGVATLLGSKSYGKGSVQELVKVTSRAALKVTIARWLTPLGKSISEGGLTPNVEVKRTADDLEKGKDPQMDKALEILAGK